ncbi:23 kDa integral membrane protein [Lamellibrachia satsuma]|nr:23 kDa integral membrane protein [Lamellibrachia satsuma]
MRMTEGSERGIALKPRVCVDLENREAGGKTRETGGKVAGAKETKASGTQDIQETEGKGDTLMGDRETDNMLPGDTTAGQNATEGIRRKSYSEVVIEGVAGIGILSVGVWIKYGTNINDYLEVIRIHQNVPIIEAAIITLITVGALMILIGFLGCCGACRESSCMLCLYAGLLVIVILGQVAAVVMGLLFKKELGNELEASMVEQAKHNVTDRYKDADVLTLAWNVMQTNLKCCGGDDFKDYMHNPNFLRSNHPVPLTCCILRVGAPDDPIPENETLCFKEATDGKADKFLNKAGCYSALYREMNTKSILLISVAAGIALIQIFGTLFACCVRTEIKKNATY